MDRKTGYLGWMGGVAQGRADRDVFTPKAQDIQPASLTNPYFFSCLEPSKAPACKTVSVGNGAMGWRSVGASLAEIRMKEGWHEKQRSNIARPEERKLARWILGVLGKSRYRCDGFFFFLATLHSMWDLSSPTRNRTCAPCSRRVRFLTIGPPRKSPGMTS